MQTHETLLVEATGAAAGALDPGAIQAALALGAGIRSDEIGLCLPAGRGRAHVEITLARAQTLATPRMLPAGETVLTLRRDGDPQAELPCPVEVRAADGGPAARPGALASALAAASDGVVGAESLGVCVPAGSSLHVSVPERVILGGKLPSSLEIDGRRFDLSVSAAAAGES